MGRKGITVAELEYDLQVTCVTKPHRDSPHEAITKLGGPGWTGSRQAIVDCIKSGEHMFHTVGGGKKAYLEVRRSAQGTEYVQTKADGVWTNNLLALPGCD